jgi:hypothetical protein
MTDTLDELVVRVRADTSGFLAGMGEVRRELDGPLLSGVERVGGGIERALSRAILTGRFSFDDLRKVALGALNDIASSALRLDLGSIFGGGGGGGLAGLIGGLLGAPGRAIGGAVAPGRPFMVGERGPELFVPTSAGRVEANNAAGGARPLNITVNVAVPAGSGPAVMQQTGAQVARAVARTLARVQA